MSYSQAAGLVWVTVSQQDCCELQSGCQIVMGYSQATGLAWVTVQPHTGASFASSVLPKANPVCLLGAWVSWMPWHVLSGDQVAVAPSHVSAPI